MARTLGWFGAWMVVGALWALSILGMMTIGIFVLPFAIAATVALRHKPGASAILTGLGLLLLYIAWLNRYGPGEHCTITPNSQSCQEMFNPWPWLLSGTALVFGGIGLFARQTARRSSITLPQRSGSDL
jgi:hypothetical protein